MNQLRMIQKALQEPAPLLSVTNPALMNQLRMVQLSSPPRRSFSQHVPRVGRQPPGPPAGVNVSTGTRRGRAERAVAERACAAQSLSCLQPDPARATDEAITGGMPGCRRGNRNSKDATQSPRRRLPLPTSDTQPTYGRARVQYLVHVWVALAALDGSNSCAL